MPLQKLCCKCHVLKNAEDFYANKRVKDGLNSFCILCHKEDSQARKRKNRADVDFRLAEQKYKKQYREKNRDAHKAYMQKWHSENSEQQILYRSEYRKYNSNYFLEYRKNNRHKLTAKSRKRQIALINRTPNWLRHDDYWMMEQAYEIAALRTKMFGFAWHVDHKIPLLGKRVSGLHVPENLQVIPAQDNISKSNKFEV
jgi:hypothetical protein